MQYPSDWQPELSKKPICGVLSVAMISRRTFAEATQAIKNNLMPHQKRHGGGTYHEQRVNTLRELGVPHVELLVSNQTLARWIKENASPGKLYMVTTSGHVVTVRDDMVADQTEIAHYSVHNSKRCFVRHVLEIV